MFSFEVVGHPEDFILDTDRISGIMTYASKHVDLPQNGVLNIAFLPDTEIQSLNNEYRGIDKTTDVLSFHYADDFSFFKKDDIAGEIIMSESKIHTQAVEHHHTPREEFEILLIHGVLHILGYDHEDDIDYEAMWQIERGAREFFGLKI